MNRATPVLNKKAGKVATAIGPVDGESVSIGSGFSAQSFRARDLGPAMDPLVLVDHYVMTEDTFGTHPHAGLSAVSLILPDSEGRFHNRDSLGNDFDLLPGDLYWLQAGRGALHNEAPTAGSRTHGLQVFVNVPQQFRFEQPCSLLVRRQDMPVISTSQHRVYVALGETNGIAGAKSPGLPMTILDGQLVRNGNFEHELASGRNAWVHAIDGAIDVVVLANETRLQKGQAIAIDNAEGGEPITVRVSAGNSSEAQFALLDGQAIKEPFVQQGPFVMGSMEEIKSINQAFGEGRFGSLD
ncbi:MAG: quercetin 2,3-dioxygenase [Lysobacteraceae bacterium]|nr:MAG: quercetin 2,3-dioxygenase [Xanthomonadaceae bacterium]